MKVDLYVNWTGDWASSYVYYGTFSSEETAKKYCKEWEKRENYRPSWDIRKASKKENFIK